MKFLSLNRNQLKYLVALAMLIDHAAWAFVPTASPAGQLMHLFGRLTGPTMAFFLAEGYLHTRDVKQYALRLGLFALLSWPATPPPPTPPPCAASARTARISSSMLATVAIRAARSKVISIKVRTLSA